MCDHAILSGGRFYIFLRVISVQNLHKFRMPSDYISKRFIFAILNIIAIDHFLQ